MSGLDPNDLRFEYTPFAEPLRWSTTTSSGRSMQFVREGEMKATWDSPDGPFAYAWAEERDMTELYETVPDLRQWVAERLWTAYEAAKV